MIFAAQVRLMVLKNMKLYQRARVATLGMLGVGVVFLVLLRLMQLSVQANTQAWQEQFGYTEHPTAIPADTLRPCVPNQETGLCYTFLYAPSQWGFANEVAATVADIAGLPGAGITQGYLGFASAGEIDEWLLLNPNTTALAAIFHDDGSDSGRVSYTLQVNHTHHITRLL